MKRALALVTITAAMVAPACNGGEGDSTTETTNTPAAGIPINCGTQNLYECSNGDGD